MPKIFVITFIHALIFGVGGLVIGLMSLGTGFSESYSTKVIYVWVYNAWQILNAPASSVSLMSGANMWAWIPTQLITSFLWANLYVFIISAVRRHNN